MTEEMVKVLTDGDLARVIDWANAEVKMRAEKHKQETIAKIRELARSIDVGVKIEGVRGRPAKATSSHTDNYKGESRAGEKRPGGLEAAGRKEPRSCAY
jgi:ferritin-like metal-binding protein YciE